ncbi:MAG TPA: transglycosylase domain-containing protein [Candidatus Cryosericum sp.]|nr:transglycosylase domain-containing protein [Candidatus Cryosericum sp.]
MAKSNPFFRVDSGNDPRLKESEQENQPLLKEREKPSSFLLAVLFTSLKMTVLAFIVVCFIGFGLLVGVVKAYVETTPSLDVAQLTISDRTSYLYDKNGDLLTTIADVEYRDWVDIENIPDMLKNAFISVEDVRFYKHSGVDFKRLFSAALEILGNSNSTGGSTITQQLIKNKILGSQRNYKRKIQEAYLALELETLISKDDILEAYLNDINLGESNYGVKTAAMDYFGKELSELTIRECAMLAGLPQAPYRYDPRKNMYQRDQMEVTNERTNQVLSRMYQAGFITIEQYDSAMTEQVNIIEVSQKKQMYNMAYFVEYSINDVITHLLEKRGLSNTSANRSAVENELRTSGYHIYTTVDPSIQNTVQATLSTWDSYPTLADTSKSLLVETSEDGTVTETVEPQAAAVVLDYHTGELRAVVGGRDEPTIRKGINRATSYTEVGSSIKPLAVYGPALDIGYSTASIVPNMDGPIQGWNTEKGYPAGGLDSRYGPVTFRRALMSSLNVCAAHVLMDDVTPAVAAEYMYQLGATESKINVDGAGLALGTSGLTPIQMAAAYGTIANGGVYLEPLSFTKVLDDKGNVILDADEVRVTHRVFQESTAYLLVDMMTDAVKSGTGTKAKITDMTVAGKTGTNSDYASVYFAGITPYYTSTLWVGHDYPANKLKKGSSGGDEAAPLWQAYMSKIHEGLTDKAIIDVDPTSLGLVKRTVCSVSGLLATDACKDDEDHKPVTDWFLASNAPTEYCDMHITLNICSAENAIATELCPPELVTKTSFILIRPDSMFYQFDDEYLLKAFPNAVRTELSTDEFIASMKTCTVHSDGSLSIFELKLNAQDLIQQVSDYLNTATGVPQEMSDKLKNDIAALEVALTGYEYSVIEPLYTTLQTDFTALQNYMATQTQGGNGG